VGTSTKWIQVKLLTRGSGRASDPATRLLRNLTMNRWEGH